MMAHGMSEDLPSSGGERRPERSRKERARVVVVAGVGVLAALFAILNLDEVEVNWIVGTFDTPLIVVIAVSILVGAALGYVAARRRTEN
jgi:uncharacterized integral membrane protein